jgi:glycosyltransferase involved in cell wall biosynthesis
MQIILTIVFSPWSPYRGGAQQSTHNMATILSRRGHDVSVVYTKPPWEQIPVPDELPYRLEWANLYATRSKCRAHLRDLVAFSVRNKVGKLIDPDQQTIVHSNGEEGGLIHQLRKDHHFKFVFTPRFAYYPDSFYEDPIPLHKKLWHWINERKTVMQLYAVRNADVLTPP